MMVPGDHPALPDNATYKYLAEGAANVVYKICRPPEITRKTSMDEREVNVPQQSDTDSSKQRPKAYESKQGT